MKKWTFKLILFFWVLNTAWVHAQVERTKKISKSYSVTGSTALNIENKFGKIHINTNNGNTIKVDVTMVGRSSDEAKAQSILDKLQIKVQGENEISFRTSIISGIRSTRSLNRNSSRSFEVNYLISMPKNVKLRVRNRYGNVFLGDFSGELDMYVAHGSIKAAKVINPQDKKIKVAFGSLDVDQVEQGELTVAYGSLKLENGEKVQVINKHSSVDINQVKNLDIQSKYGKLIVAEVDNISGTSSYEKVKIGVLNNSCTLALKYSKGFAVSRVNKNFKKIDIYGKYSPMDFRFENGASFDYQINTQFGKLVSALMRSKKIGDYYKGKFGNSNAKSKVSIKSQYSTVSIK